MATWQEISEDHGGDLFGRSIDLGIDLDGGVWAVVGAPDNSEVGTDQGRAYLYKRTGVGLDQWTKKQELVPSTPENGAHFGTQVKFLMGAPDGDTLFIGSPWKSNGGSNRGSVYVLTRSGDVWTEQQEIAGTSNNTHFGQAIDCDDTKVAIAAPDTYASGYKGYACVYKWGGTAWDLEDTVNATGQANGDAFGYSIAIEGSKLMVGSYYWVDGAAYYFTESAGVWTQQQRISGSSTWLHDLDMYGDTCVLGYRDDGQVWRLSGGTWAKSHDVDPAGTYYLGACVLLEDEDTVYLGGNYAVDPNGSRAFKYTGCSTGSADQEWSYSYDDCGGSSSQQDQFGRDIAVLYGITLIGVPDAYPSPDYGAVVGLDLYSGPPGIYPVSPYDGAVDVSKDSCVVFDSIDVSYTEVVLTIRGEIVFDGGKVYGAWRASIEDLGGGSYRITVCPERQSYYDDGETVQVSAGGTVWTFTARRETGLRIYPMLFSGVREADEAE